MTAATFEHVETHRAELKAHCYRMLGSAFDAEDAVQETILRAWRSVERFEGRTTLRGWLYRIATNVCLTMLGRDKRKRITPYLSSPVATDYPSEPPGEVAWLEPYPTPAEEFERKEEIELAFVAAIAYLPPKQRAALLLTDVVGWSAAETARALETSVPAINSALQRARDTLRKKAPTLGSPRLAETAVERDLLARYMRALESNDIAALAKLLKDDAILSMPPRMEWYQGRDQIHEFLVWAIAQTEFTEIRTEPTRANSQPAMAMYGYREGSWHKHAIHVLTIENGQIAVINNFMDEALFTLFPELPAS